jgi:nucleotide-binding universal stress UspA family protein
MKVRTSRRSGNVVLEMEPKDQALPPAAVPELQIKRILVPVDFSPCSRKAFHYAIHFARQFNAELMLLHVIESIPIPPQPMAFEALENPALESQQREELARRLSGWRSEAAPPLTVKAVTRTGASAQGENIEAARENNADLIVIGNHGRTGLSRWLIGGTTERVVRYAPCPVLVIREREHDFVAEEKTSTSTS